MSDGIERARLSREIAERAITKRHSAAEPSDPPPSDAEPSRKIKGSLSTAIAHFSAWAEARSKRLLALFAVVGTAYGVLACAFAYWLTTQKTFTQEQGKLMLDQLARIDASMRAEAETRKGLQERLDRAEGKLVQHEIDIGVLKTPGRTPEQIQGKQPQSPEKPHR